jgi:hypothetical protein
VQVADFAALARRTDFLRDGFVISTTGNGSGFESRQREIVLGICATGATGTTGFSRALIWRLILRLLEKVQKMADLDRLVSESLLRICVGQQRL